MWALCPRGMNLVSAKQILKLIGQIAPDARRLISRCICMRGKSKQRSRWRELHGEF